MANLPPGGGPPGGEPTGGGVPFVPAAPQKPASMARYKRELRKEIKRRHVDPEINFLNITAMLDMMTIILVFLLKTMTTSTAAIPQGEDLKIPSSVIAKSQCEEQLVPGHETDDCPEPEGIAIFISKTNVVVGDHAVCPVPPDADKGVEARYKRGSRNDYGIVPLESALQSFRDTDKKVRAAQHKDPGFSEAIVVADLGVPYRLLFEVLYTLGQNEFSKQHIMVLQGSPAAPKTTP